MAITTNENDIKERLSVAYLTAVAGAAGLQVMKPEIDKSSIDALVLPISGLRGRQVQFQLKATSSVDFVTDQVSFQLPIKNYNDLRDPDSTNPHYLLIVHLPGPATTWLEVSPTQLAIRGAAFFANLSGLPETPNHTSKTIFFPKSQVFDVDMLRQMMENAPSRLGSAHV